MQILAAEAAIEWGEGMQITCKNCNKRKKCRPKSSTQYFVNSRNSYSLNSAESGWENSILQRLKFG